MQAIPDQTSQQSGSIRGIHAPHPPNKHMVTVSSVLSRFSVTLCMFGMVFCLGLFGCGGGLFCMVVYVCILVCTYERK